MGLSHKSLSSVTKEDLEQLRHGRVREDKVIEYKLKEPEKSKFLASVCSFANCMGGDLLLGVKEEGGVPLEFPGLPILDTDAEIARLENIFRDGIEPRITNLTYQPVPVGDATYVMVIRIPRSWALPHRVKDTRRFFSRHSAGHYELDIPEIRAAFELSDTTTEKIRGFRAMRLSHIIAGETPVQMRGRPKLILHIVPFGGFDPTVHLDAATLERDSPQEAGWQRRLNIDGFLLSEHEGAYASAYLQLFRNGTMELVDDRDFLISDVDPKINKKLILPRYEKDIVNRVPRYLTSLKRLGIAPPFVLMLSFVGVAQFTMHLQGVSPLLYPWLSQTKTIEKDALLVPDILIEAYDVNIPATLKPAFDSVWNAAGLPHSIHYDHEGNWKPN